MKWLMFLALLGTDGEWKTVGTVSDYVYYSQDLCELEARQRTAWEGRNPRESANTRYMVQSGNAKYICVQESEKYWAEPGAIVRTP